MNSQKSSCIKPIKKEIALDKTLCNKHAEDKPSKITIETEIWLDVAICKKKHPKAEPSNIIIHKAH